MGFSKDYSDVPDWVEKPEGYQAGEKVKYEGNIFVANFWASKPGEGEADENGWRLYDELYDVTSSSPTEQVKIIGYIPTWRKEEGFDYANEEMYLNITHGIISFLMFDRNNLGEFESKSSDDVKAVLSDIVQTGHRCGTKISIALGGATDYGFIHLMEQIGNNPGDPVLEKAVKKVVDFVNSNNLDGVDLDLECWWDENNDASKDQGGRLKSDGAHPAGKGLTEFAKQLKQAMPGKIISAALFATSWYGNCYDPGLAEHVEWLGIMTYDLTGSWNQSPVGPQTALMKIRKQEEYAEEQQGEWPANRKSSANATDPMSDNPILSVEDSLWYWTNPFFTNWQGKGQNLKRNKIAAGVPLYGYDFAHGKEPDDLSGQVPPGYKVIRYKDLLSQFPGADTAANGNIKVAGSSPRPPFVSTPGTYPYAHNIYCETPKTATDKLNFLKSVGVQDVIIWELTNDVWENGKSIVKELYQNSGNPSKEAKPVEPPAVEPPAVEPPASDWTPENWMGALDENKLLSEFTIPGTHETCSLHGGPITECQRLSLSEQLNAGIRAIDIRCRHFRNAFPIHHGAVYQKKNFTDVLNDCKAFLDSHPTECIVMFVKNECTGEIGSCTNEQNTPLGQSLEEPDVVTTNPVIIGPVIVGPVVIDDTTGDRTFEDTFDWYLDQDNNRDYFYLDENIPQLKDVRKKIVLIRRFPAKRTPKGIVTVEWKDGETFSSHLEPDGKNSGTLEVQDEYDVKVLGNIPSKWAVIKELLDKAKNDPKKENWYINFTSGSSPMAYPNAVAGRINHLVSAYVEDKSLKHVRLGTIMTDYPDDNGKTDMINRIIEVNFR